MGPETRTSSSGLMQALLGRPHSFSFFQAVRLLQCYSGGAPIGSGAVPSDEGLRLRPAVSMSFPKADLVEISIDDSQASGKPRFCITTSFLGLSSTDSPLPNFYIEDLLWKETDQDAVKEFLSIFHHRILSLFYRAWEKYRFGIRFRSQGDDEFSRRIFACIGLGAEPLINLAGPSPVRLLRYAGLITQKPHSASALAGILKDYFAQPAIEIEQCAERRVRISPDQRNRLGVKNCTLGTQLSIGSEVRDLSGKFRIGIGPLNLPEFISFLPNGENYSAVIHLVRFYVNDRLDFDFRMELKAEEVPRLALSSHSPQRLGWTTWLPGARRNPAVVCLRPAFSSAQTERAERLT